MIFLKNSSKYLNTATIYWANTDLKKKSFEGPDGAAVKWIRSSPNIFIRFQEFIDGWFTQLVMEGAQIETNNFRLPVRSKRAILRQNK